MVPFVELQRVLQILLSPEAFSLSTRDQECSRACTEESPRTDVRNRESKGTRYHPQQIRLYSGNISLEGKRVAFGGELLRLNSHDAGGHFAGRCVDFFLGWKKSPPGNSAFSWPFWQWRVSSRDPFGKVGILKKNPTNLGIKSGHVAWMTWMIIIIVTTTIIS